MSVLYRAGAATGSRDLDLGTDHALSDVSIVILELIWPRWEGAPNDQRQFVGTLVPEYRESLEITDAKGVCERVRLVGIPVGESVDVYVIIPSNVEAPR